MQQMETRGNAVIESKTVAPSDLPFEFMLNALRLSNGVSTISFSERTGLPLHVIAPALQAASKKGLLDENPAVLKPTALGLRYLNDLQAIFL
jgi:oxygen-independent coproporphyrinogen-3 oxidase